MMIYSHAGIVPMRGNVSQFRPTTTKHARLEGQNREIFSRTPVYHHFVQEIIFCV